MKLSTIDIFIILAYLLATVVIGLVLRKQAERSKKDYLLGGNVLKWYWWRFNGTGFFWGMVGGLVPALSFRFIFEGVLDLYTFPLMLLISVIGCVIGTYAAPPVNEEVLKAFYKNVRPWGFWRPIHDKVVAEDPGFKANTNFGRDMFNVFIGVIWQTTLVIFPIYIVLLEAVPALVAIAVAAVCTLILKKNWFDKLPKDEKRETAGLAREEGLSARAPA